MEKQISAARIDLVLPKVPMKKNGISFVCQLPSSLYDSPPEVIATGKNIKMHHYLEETCRIL